MTCSALLSHRMLLAAGLVALAAAAPAQANLIVNGGAESDVGSGPSYADIDVTGFAPETGAFTAVRYGSGAFPSAATSTQLGGGANFLTGGASAVATGEQRIDVSSLAATIDAGRGAYTLSGHLGGYASQADDARVAAQFLGAGDAVLSTAVIGPVTTAERANATTLLPRTSTGTAPTGTRAVRVVVTLTRVSGTSNDGYADNLSFTIAPSTAQTPVALPSTGRPTVTRSAAVGTLPKGGRTVTVTPSTACLLTATTKFRLPARPTTGGARQNAVGSRLVGVYRIPGARVTVPPVRITALVPRQPVKVPVVPVTTRVPAPGVPRVVNPPRVPTVTTVTCRPLAGVTAPTTGALQPAPGSTTRGAPARLVTAPTVVNPPPAPPVADKKLTPGRWSGAVREVNAPAPAGRVSFTVAPDGRIRDFTTLGVAETCFSPAGGIQGGRAVSSPFFVGVRLQGAISVLVGGLPKTVAFAFAPPAPTPTGVEYIRISNPGMVFDSDRSVFGSAEAFRRLGGNAYCQLRFTFNARPGGSTATGTAAFTYTD